MLDPRSPAPPRRGWRVSPVAPESESGPPNAHIINIANSRRAIDQNGGAERIIINPQLFALFCTLQDIRIHNPRALQYPEPLERELETALTSLAPTAPISTWIVTHPCHNWKTIPHGGDK